MLIDVNAYVGRWPFLQFGPTTSGAVEESLRQAGVTRACVSSVEAILAPDPSLEEERLAREIQGNDFFVHTPLISPMLYDWRDRLKQARDEYGSKMIRLLPTYHRYAPDGAEACAIAQAAADLGLHVAVVMRIEDERAHYPLMKVPAPTTENIAVVAKAIAPSPLVVLGCYRWELIALAQEPNTLLDLSHAEGAHPLRELLEVVSAKQMLFGSHAPFLYAQAQVGKLQHGQLSDADFGAIAGENAEAFV